MNPQEFLVLIKHALDGAGIPYMVTGSFASAFHGAPRSTFDIDLLISADRISLGKFVAAFPLDRYYVSEEAALEALDARGQFNVIDSVSGWKADFIIQKEGAHPEAEMSRRTEHALLGVRLFIASKEDSIISKLQWAKESESEKQIRDVAGMLLSRETSIDSDYLENWIRKLGLQAQYESAKRKAGVA